MGRVTTGPLPDDAGAEVSETDGRAAPVSACLGLRSTPDPAFAARIAAMPADSWLDLGPPAPDPVWGSASGRGWAGKMAYAGELHAAVITGEGPAGSVATSGPRAGRFNDDVFLYDISQHRWVCVYPGATLDTVRVLDANGFEATPEGEAVPIDYLYEGSNNVSYVSRLHKIMIMTAGSAPYWPRSFPQRWTWLDKRFPEVAAMQEGVTGPIIADRSHPIFFDVSTCRWERRFVTEANRMPLLNYGQFLGVLEYLELADRAFWFDNHTEYAWLYDFAANAWSRLGERAPLSYDHNGAHDPVRQKVYFFREAPFFISFDLRTGVYEKIEVPGHPPVSAVDGESQGSNYATVTYDTTADALVYMRRFERAVYVFHLQTQTWSKAVPAPDVSYYSALNNFNVAYYVGTGFYDQSWNAHFYYFAQENNGQGFMLAYRVQ